MTYIFVDPGKMTGYVMAWKPADAPWVCRGAELSHDDFLDTSFKWLKDSPMFIRRVVVENFDITPTTYQTLKKKDPVWAIEQIGCLRTWCRWFGVPFELQSRSAKSFDADGTKLKKLNWWAPEVGVTGEEGHRRDAARHAVSWLINHGVMNPEVLL